MTTFFGVWRAFGRFGNALTYVVQQQISTALASLGNLSVAGNIARSEPRRLAPAADAPTRLSQAHQWAVATGVVGAALANAEALGRSHESARLQIEAARYALDELMGELGCVLRVEPVSGGRRDAASPAVATGADPAQSIAA
ncbi:MAG: hypothetical protein R3D27_12450 [Hyphomicrobiaceae bacterium]